MTNDNWLALKLHDEVNMGHIEVVRGLLEKGVDVNSKDALGSTPLLAAAYTGQADMVRLLLEFEADMTARDLCGKTAQHLAEELGFQGVLSVFAEQVRRRILSLQSHEVRSK